MLKAFSLLLVLASGFFASTLNAQAKKPEPVRFVGVEVTAEAPSMVASPTNDPRFLRGEFDLDPERGVVDADTLRLSGVKDSLRLIGVDAEETFKDEGLRALAARDYEEYVRTVTAGTKKERPPKYGTPMGEAAADFARHFFKDVKKLRVERDEEGRDVDGYGRMLVVVLAMKSGGYCNYNVELVRQGLSPYFQKYGRSARYHEAFLAAEAEAKAKKRGIHASPAPHHCYPDYDLRYAWWAERERDLTWCQAKRKAEERIYLLGETNDFEALKKMEGQIATVAGSRGDLRRTSGLHLQAFNHKKGEDFMIVGSEEEVKKLGLQSEDGNILLLTGTISLHKGNPQFQATTVSWKRVPKPAPER